MEGAKSAVRREAKYRAHSARAATERRAVEAAVRSLHEGCLRLGSVGIVSVGIERLKRVKGCDYSFRGNLEDCAFVVEAAMNRRAVKAAVDTADQGRRGRSAVYATE